jgi:hypothetical protein
VFLVILFRRRWQFVMNEPVSSSSSIVLTRLAAIWWCVSWTCIALRNLATVVFRYFLHICQYNQRSSLNTKPYGGWKEHRNAEWWREEEIRRWRLNSCRLNKRTQSRLRKNKQGGGGLWEELYSLQDGKNQNLVRRWFPDSARSSLW